MAITSVKDPPVTEPGGTIGAFALANFTAGCGRALNGTGSVSTLLMAGTISLVKLKAAILELHAGSRELRHELIIMRCDDNGGAETVQFDEKPQQAARHLRIDVTGRLVGEKKLRLGDHSPGDSGALLFPAGKHSRKSVHPVPEPHPFEQFGDIFLVIALMPAHDAERKCNILPSGEMIEEPEILKNDPDAPPEVGALACRILGYISSEKVYKSACGAVRHIEESKKRGFASARSSGQKMKRSGQQMEVDIAQNLLPHSVAEADILETNKSMTRYHNPTLLFALDPCYDKRVRSSNRFRQRRDGGNKKSHPIEIIE